MRGPPPFGTCTTGRTAARRWRGLPGARGAARARPRVALVCAALGPPRRNARRGCPNPPRYAKKCRTAGVSVPPGPSRGGPRVPLPPLAAFSPARPRPALPPRLGWLCWLSGRWASPSRVAGRAPSVRREGAAVPRSPAFLVFRPVPRLALHGGPLPPHLSALSDLFFPGQRAYGGPVRPAPPLRAAILYRECSVLEHVLTAIGSRRENFPLALGLIPCAYSFATEKQPTATAWAVPPVIPNRVSAEGTAGPLGCLYHDDLLSVRFIGHLPLTFPSVCGKILSESVMSPMARRTLSRCPWLHPLMLFFGLPPVQSSACTGGNSVTPRVKGSACAAPWARFSFALSHAKIAGHSGIRVNSKKRPPGPFFRRVDNAAFVNRTLPPLSGGCRTQQNLACCCVRPEIVRT